MTLIPNFACISGVQKTPKRWTEIMPKAEALDYKKRQKLKRWTKK